MAWDEREALWSALDGLLATGGARGVYDALEHIDAVKHAEALLSASGR